MRPGCLIFDLSNSNEIDHIRKTDLRSFSVQKRIKIQVL
jgi:hypothetical protein